MALKDQMDVLAKELDLERTTFTKLEELIVERWPSEDDD
jgi:hypothetical protein